ncbi:hypothetical protein [Tumebacillus algifaecis]|nr:hypothetical protein [Tumebacillus algifaecis]
MKSKLANLTPEQHTAINRLESELGVVLVAYDNYKQEGVNGELLQQ